MSRQSALKAWRTRRGPYYHISKNSNNRKTGNMVVITSSQKTCPDTCPLKNNGCYADCGHLLLHWNKVTNGERGVAWNQFIEELERLKR